MLRAVQTNLCELPKANDVATSKSDDLTLSNREINTTDEEGEDNDCVYVSPDEAENGKPEFILSLKIVNEMNLNCEETPFHLQNQYSLIRTTMLAETLRLHARKRGRPKWNAQKWCPYDEN